MRSRFRIVACGVIGLLPTILVAWACALCGPYIPAYPGERAALVWGAEVPKAWPEAPSSSVRWSQLGRDIIRHSWSDQRTAPDIDRPRQYRLALLVTYRVGWPFRSGMHGHLSEAYSDSVAGVGNEIRTTMGGGNRIIGLEVPRAIASRTDRQGPHVPGAPPMVGVPVNVLWPGFALDTAFYGTLAFLLSSAPGFVKRTRRRRLGLCVACGYELKGMQKCPECGRGAEAESLSVSTLNENRRAR